MKRTVSIIGIFLTILVLAVGSASSLTWYTYREDIAVSSGYADLDLVKNLGYTSAVEADISGNITLPCNIGNLTAMNFSVYKATNISSYNLTVNTKALNASSSTNVTAKSTNWTSLAHYTADSGSQTVTYIAWSFNASAACSLNITIQGTDVTFDTDWLANTSVFTINERDLTTPTVGMSSSAFWTVNNSFNVTSNLAVVNMSNVVFNITYPGHTIGTPTTTNFTITSLAINGTSDQYTQYQKRAPYTYDIDEDVDGSVHEVTVYLRADEVLTNIVDWTIDPDDDFYDGFFDTVDSSSLVIELNNIEKDWDLDGTDIELTEFTTRAVHTLNKFEFTWTVPAVIEPEAVAGFPGLMDEVLFLPLWLWITIIAIVIIAVVAMVWQYYYKK